MFGRGFDSLRLHLTHKNPLFGVGFYFCYFYYYGNTIQSLIYYPWKLRPYIYCHGVYYEQKTTKGDQWPVWLPNTKSYEKSKNWDYAQVYSAKVMMKYGGYFLLLCLPGYFMDLSPEIATGAGLIVLLIGVAFMIFQVETHLKKWESDSSKGTNK